MVQNHFLFSLQLPPERYRITAGHETQEKPIEGLRNKVTMEGNMGLLLVSAMRAVSTLKRYGR